MLGKCSLNAFIIMIIIIIIIMLLSREHSVSSICVRRRQLTADCDFYIWDVVSEAYRMCDRLNTMQQYITVQ